MKIEINVTASFSRAARPLIKRYRSFLGDLAKLENELRKEPRLGSSLGGNLFKIRLKISSKGKGESGGARVISFLEVVGVLEKGRNEITVVNLLTVYDKSEKSDISDSELRKLIGNLKNTG